MLFRSTALQDEGSWEVDHPANVVLPRNSKDELQIFVALHRTLLSLLPPERLLKTFPNQKLHQNKKSQISILIAGVPYLAS